MIEHSFLNGNVSGSAIVEFTSPRGLSFGEEYFGTFTKALYTLFQLLLGDSWSEVVTRSTQISCHFPFARHLPQGMCDY